MGTIRGVRVYRRVTNSPFYLDLISVKNPIAYVMARTYRVAGPASDIPPPSFATVRSFRNRMISRLSFYSGRHRA